MGERKFASLFLVGLFLEALVWSILSPAIGAITSEVAMSTVALSKRLGWHPDRAV
jgi:hypothetical protein